MTAPPGSGGNTEVVGSFRLFCSMFCPPHPRVAGALPCPLGDQSQEACVVFPTRAHGRRLDSGVEW